MKNLVNTEYITLEELLDSIKMDFKKYAQSGIIDDASLYKTVAYCNADAGIRINPIEYCVAEIVDGKIELPANLKKIKKIDILSNFKVPSSLPFFQNWTEQVTTQPKKNTPLYTPIGCHSDCGQCYWIVPYKAAPEQWLVFSNHSPLTNSSSHHLRHDEYSIDREEDVIKFGVKSGKVMLTYYIDMDAIGLIPKHPMLFNYYEASVKVKILTDILMNSEDDVINKLKFAKQEMLEAYVDFDKYIKSISFKKAQEMYNRHEQDFFNKWFSPILG